MARNVPTPYVFAPTKSGKKLPWELGRPDQRDIPAEPTESDSAAQSSASPTPQRPVRGALFDRWRQGLLVDAQDQPAETAEPIHGYMGSGCGILSTIPWFAHRNLYNFLKQPQAQTLVKTSISWIVISLFE